MEPCQTRGERASPPDSAAARCSTCKTLTQQPHCLSTRYHCRTPTSSVPCRAGRKLVPAPSTKNLAKSKPIPFFFSKPPKSRRVGKNHVSLLFLFDPGFLKKNIHWGWKGKAHKSRSKMEVRHDCKAQKQRHQLAGKREEKKSQTHRATEEEKK